jgi:hypothetical protein
MKMQSFFIFMKQIVLLFIFLLFVVTSFSQVERGFQIWNKNEIVIRPWKEISIEVAEKVHYSPEHGAADIKYAEMFLSHKPLDWFKYGAGFRITKLNTYPGWIQENRPMLFADFLKSYKQFSFKYSNRVEYRMFEFDIDHFRYRQEFLVEFPSLADWGMRFYTSEESFFKFNSAGLHLARFYGGLSVVQKEHFKLKMFYALEKLELVENWRTTDIVGLNLSFII